MISAGDHAVRVTGSTAHDPWTDAPGGGTVERPLADRTGGGRR